MLFLIDKRASPSISDIVVSSWGGMARIVE